MHLIIERILILVFKLGKKNVYDRFQKLELKYIQLVGNLDVYYKNTNEINAVESLLEDYDNIVSISSPDHIKLVNQISL